MFTIIHLLISLPILLLLGSFVHLEPTSILLFIVGSVILDIDHLITIYSVDGEVYATAREILRLKQIRKFFIFLSKRHKEINKLRFHNYIGFLLVFLAFEIALLLNFDFSFLFLGLLTHMIEDQLDDIWILGHLRNWLWIFRPIKGYRVLILMSILIIIVSYMQILII